MNELKHFSARELGLLLYLETCAVDLSGRVDIRRIDESEFKIIKEWNDAAFIEFGRIVADDINRQGANWVELSNAAWVLAHKERRARHERNPRRYRRTCDKED